MRQSPTEHSAHAHAHGHTRQPTGQSDRGTFAALPSGTRETAHSHTRTRHSTSDTLERSTRPPVHHVPRFSLRYAHTPCTPVRPPPSPPATHPRECIAQHAHTRAHTGDGSHVGTRESTHDFVLHRQDTHCARRSREDARTPTARRRTKSRLARGRALSLRMPRSANPHRLPRALTGRAGRLSRRRVCQERPHLSDPPSEGSHRACAAPPRLSRAAVRPDRTPHHEAQTLRKESQLPVHSAVPSWHTPRQLTRLSWPARQPTCLAASVSQT